MSRKIKVSPDQKAIFNIDDNGNVTYLINGFPQSYEDLLTYNPDYEDLDLESIDPYTLVGYEAETLNQVLKGKVEKEDNRTIQLSISDLEKVKRILTSIPQFKDMAAALEFDINNIDGLAEVLDKVDLMSLPHFEVDMSIFNIFPQNNPEYRRWLFCTILEVIHNIGLTNKFPSRRSLKILFSEFNEDQFEVIYSLIKRLLSTLNAWGGIQIHYFEQLIRDWLYITYEKGNDLTYDQICEYLRTKYPCKSDYEVKLLTDLLANANSFVPSIDDFIGEYFRFIASFTPEFNMFLTEEEIYLLWTSDFLKLRILKQADKWRQRIYESQIIEPDNELDEFFGVRRRLSQRSIEGCLPEEVAAADSINEVLIKLKLYFPEGHRTLIEARIDRLTRTEGKVSVYDWKTRKKALEEMNDFEKLQIILQCIAVQNLTNSVKPGRNYTPMTNGDYRFFLTQTNTAFLRPNTLPDFYHIPENSEETFDYVALGISMEEVNRILSAFNKIVSFLIANKKVMSRLKNYLKQLDGYIPTPQLVEPTLSIIEQDLVLVEA